MAWERWAPTCSAGCAAAEAPEGAVAKPCLPPPPLPPLRELLEPPLSLPLPLPFDRLGERGLVRVNVEVVASEGRVAPLADGGFGGRPGPATTVPAVVVLATAWAADCPAVVDQLHLTLALRHNADAKSNKQMQRHNNSL